MNIKEIREKYKDSKPTTILLRDLIIEAEIKSMPDKPLMGELIILDDGTGTLEAAAKDSQTFELLKKCLGKTITIKGYLEKHEYDDLAFTVEKILY